MSDFWVGVGVGALGALVVLALIVPDPWAVWLATRKNLPTWLMPFGLVALLVGLGNLTYAVGAAVLAALANTRVAPWVWLATLVGAVVLIVFFLLRRHNNRHGKAK